jgi:hypothetical protein
MRLRGGGGTERRQNECVRHARTVPGRRQAQRRSRSATVQPVVASTWAPAVTPRRTLCLETDKAAAVAVSERL